ncbi:MAG: copper chaperone PCu(A)C [Ilumatobacteraceae bacterium]|nr:copper chaperone PCu(A)C [Ilumatobacteraceae bacterium]
MKRSVSVLLTAAIALTACGSDDDVTVAGAWARASAPTQTSGAVYFDLTVADDDALIGASVPASVASRAEIHEVVMVDGSMDTSEDAHDMSGDDMDDTEMSEGSDDMSDTSDMDDMGDMEGGQMSMRELPDGLALTAGETVSFEPGSYHVMLPELADPLEVGDEFDLTLDFRNADDVTITVQVAETAP